MNYNVIHLEASDTTYEGLSELLLKIENASANAPFLVLDFHNVRMMNSAGLGVLIRSHKDLRLEKGGLILVAANETLQSIFRNAGIANIMPVYNTLREFEDTEKLKKR